MCKAYAIIKITPRILTHFKKNSKKNKRSKLGCHLDRLSSVHLELGNLPCVSHYKQRKWKMPSFFKKKKKNPLTREAFNFSIEHLSKVHHVPATVKRYLRQKCSDQLLRNDSFCE